MIPRPAGDALSPLNATPHSAVHKLFAKLRCAAMKDNWEHFEHGADIGLRGFGHSKAAAFEQAALALTGVVTSPGHVAPRDSVDIACEAPDDESLLVEWLNALVLQMALRHMLFSRFHVEIDGRQLRAHAFGEPVSVTRHRPAVEVKGATFTGLRVTPTADGRWMAQTVVDV